MILLVSFISFLVLETISIERQAFKTYDNYNKGDRVYGRESSLTDYALLSNDLEGNLPFAFTICTSYFIQFTTGDKNFVHLNQRDGTHWIAYQVGVVKNLDDFTERVTLIFKLRVGASRSSHVGRSVSRSVGRSVGPWKILTIFDIKVS